MDKDSQAVSEQLNRALAESGLSQAAFATALGTSASRFSTYRSGRTKPTAQIFLRAGRIARALHAAREYRIMTAPTTAAAIRDASDEEWACGCSSRAATTCACCYAVTMVPKLPGRRRQARPVMQASMHSSPS